MKKITAVVVEDSELARLELLELLKAYTNIEIAGEAWDVQSAVSLFNEVKPELLFMDIDLPGGNAFDILSQIEGLPKIIFTTAFDQFAIQAFDYNTVDYLLKPVKQQRLTQAITKLAGNPVKQQTQVRRLGSDQSFFVKDGEKCWVIKVSDLEYIESVGNYSRLFFNNQAAMHNMTLTAVEERLDDTLFFKISRSHIVNINKIVHIEPWVTGGFQITLQSGQTLEVSRRQAVKFKQQIQL